MGRGDVLGGRDLAAFRPRSQDDLAPSGAVARVRANLDVLRTLRLIEDESRPAEPSEQAVIARWSGWGAVPEVFDDRHPEMAWARAELATLLAPDEMAAAARNTLNAHYTDAALVATVWRGVEALGFAGGSVLEPGCGSGTFIGLAPHRAQMTGVELDPTTARVARALYPAARILGESFADTSAPDGIFDLAIGNVPFDNFSLTDRRHNAAHHSIHNHFIIKSLHLTRPGGLVAVLTSRYTLDAQNPAARREMAGLADLVGAVRLPEGTHRRAAGTDVVTDLLILRRREPEAEPAGDTFERSVKVEVTGGVVAMNEWFVAHPSMVLGDISCGTGPYGPGDLVVTRTAEDVPALLDEALATLALTSVASGLSMTERTGDASSVVLAARSESRAEGYLAVAGDDFTVVSDRGAIQPYEPRVKSQAPELRDLLGIRDSLVVLLETEASSLDDTPDLSAMRRDLNRRYDAYVNRYGPLNRFSWRRTGRLDEEGNERHARVRPGQGGFAHDPYSGVVYALEVFDAADQSVVKAPVLRARVIAPLPARLGADTPADALAICLDERGRVEIGEVARLLGTTDAESRAALGELVYDEPVTGRLVPAPEYLSGDVRDKLRAARAAADDDGRFTPNVLALAAGIPADLGPGEIDGRLGAVWIDATYVERFLREILEDSAVLVEHLGGSEWAVRGGRHGVLATSTWGTGRMSAGVLAGSLLAQRPIQVRDRLDDGSSVPNLLETVAAQEKATELGERFSEWLWEDPVRSDALARRYNDVFNAIVLRTYDDTSPSLPGMALSFEPRRHQLAAVARIVAEPTVLLAHDVGAGKTAIL